MQAVPSSGSSVVALPGQNLPEASEAVVLRRIECLLQLGAQLVRLPEALDEEESKPGRLPGSFYLTRLPVLLEADRPDAQCDPRARRPAAPGGRAARCGAGAVQDRRQLPDPRRARRDRRRRRRRIAGHGAGCKASERGLTPPNRARDTFQGDAPYPRSPTMRGCSTGWTRWNRIWSTGSSPTPGTRSLSSAAAGDESRPPRDRRPRGRPPPVRLQPPRQPGRRASPALAFGRFGGRVAARLAADVPGRTRPHGVAATAIQVWTFDLAPGATKDIGFGYKVTWPADRPVNLD